MRLIDMMVGVMIVIVNGEREINLLMKDIQILKQDMGQMRSHYIIDFIFIMIMLVDFGYQLKMDVKVLLRLHQVVQQIVLSIGSRL